MRDRPYDTAPWNPRRRRPAVVPFRRTATTTICGTSYLTRRFRRGGGQQFFRLLLLVFNVLQNLLIIGGYPFVDSPIQISTVVAFVLSYFFFIIATIVVTIDVVSAAYATAIVAVDITTKETVVDDPTGQACRNRVEP